jgi:hypothetical protein
LLQQENYKKIDKIGSSNPYFLELGLTLSESDREKADLALSFFLLSLESKELEITKPLSRAFLSTDLQSFFFLSVKNPYWVLSGELYLLFFPFLRMPLGNVPKFKSAEYLISNLILFGVLSLELLPEFLSCNVFACLRAGCFGFVLAVPDALLVDSEIRFLDSGSDYVSGGCRIVDGIVGSGTGLQNFISVSKGFLFIKLLKFNIGTSSDILNPNSKSDGSLMEEVPLCTKGWSFM